MAASQMAPGRLSGLNGSDVFQSNYLLQQVANYIHIHHLQSLAIDIEICVTDLDIIKGGKHIVEQRFRVLKKWMDTRPRNFTISEFIEKVERWRQNGYVDCAVWRHLEEEGLDPEILPLSSATERPASKRGVKRMRSPDPPYTSCFSREDYEIPSKEDANALQHLTRCSLSRQYGMMVAKDWLEPDDADSLPVKEHYVDLKWTKLERGVENLEKDLPSIYSILDVVDSEKPAEGINLLIEAEPGMGKTWSTAYLALGWADESKKCPEDSPLRKMDYVFWIRLRDVGESSTLAETIINQHDQIQPEHRKHLTAILKGKTKHRVLILMDGYDEYRSNRDIDNAINYSVGNCVLILTSRPKYLKNSLRSKFVGEVKIIGLSQSKIDEFCERMLKENHKEFLEQAVETDIVKLFHIPIILYITLLIYKQKRTFDLPGSRAEVFKDVFELTIARSTLKHLDCKSSEIQHLLFKLGRISFYSRKRGDVYLKMDDIQEASPDILKLGLLFEVANNVDGIRPGTKRFAFQHKLFHEYAAAFYVTKRLESGVLQEVTLSELFTSWSGGIHSPEEVVLFTHGLLQDPAPLVYHVYQLCVKECIEDLESGYGNLYTLPSYKRLFEAFFLEKKSHQDGSKYHNKYLNYYDHDPSRTKKLADIDLSPIHNPSKIYWFENLLKPPSIAVVRPRGAIPTRVWLVHFSHRSVTGAVLMVGKELEPEELDRSVEQPITELCLSFKPSQEVIFNLSQEAHDLDINNCVLDPQVSRFAHTCRCVRLQKLYCSSSEPSMKVADLDLSRSSSLTSLEFNNIDLSPELCEKLCRDLKYLVALETLHLSDIPIATSCHFLTEAVSSMQLLKTLMLWGPCIPPTMLTQLITALHNCPKLNRVVVFEYQDYQDKQAVTIDHIEDSIEALPLMEYYRLENCHLPGWFCRQVLKSLSRSKNLRELNLSGNILTETVQNFLSRDDESLPELETLELSSAGLARNDLEHLKNVISQGKLPSLKLLNLSYNNLEGTEDLVKDLVQRWICHKNYQLKKIELLLKNTSLPEDLSDLDWLKKYKGRNCLLQSEVTVVATDEKTGKCFKHRQLFPLKSVMQSERKAPQ